MYKRQSDTLPLENKLAPLSSAAPLPKISPGFSGLDKSSLPPIKTERSDSADVSKTKLSDLVDLSEPQKVDNSVSIPGMFQNKYVEVQRVENKPALSMNSLHTIRVDRSKFIDNVAS